MAFKVFVAFIWFLTTAFVVCVILEIVHSHLDMLSKIFLYIVGVFIEMLIRIWFIEGIEI